MYTLVVLIYIPLSNQIRMNIQRGAEKILCVKIINVNKYIFFYRRIQACFLTNKAKFPFEKTLI